MTEWHPLRSSENIVSASWKELDREAEENGRRCTSAALPSLRHASLKDYVNVYEPSDDTYLLLDGMLLDMESVLRYKDDSDCKDRHVVLEIGTGSGVPITFLTTQLIKNNAKVHAIATDINPKALEFAQKTAHENQVSIQTIQCDLATALLQEYAGKVDVIIFNPPYVPTPDEEVTGNGIEVSWAGEHSNIESNVYNTFTMRPFLVLVNLLFFVPAAVSEYEVPTKKAMPPKMDPIPTLPVVTHRTYMDISIDGETKGRIVFGLFGEVAPKAVENFVALCNCDHGKAKVTKKDLCYKHTPIHRVIPNFLLQGGDFTHGDGTGGESIFGEPFEDESFKVKHNRRYLLSMANDGKGKPHTNRSQWFINTVKTQWLDGINEVFGMVLEGLDVITAVERVGTNGGTTLEIVMVEDSGSLPLEPEDATPRLVSDILRK
ncbi:peptidyl-prolyl cis-trans isomerase [Nitzschia inconspicua]|uniref:peptidylprolyl isomerase n=1 Tax=Nitzschia inconspicua TaxID=303405 RepID=A0A9K3PG32_9STRA|nr:peptidyl-prolyl cis-trans isomerase [Nitzschia inconspicua]